MKRRALFFSAGLLVASTVAFGHGPPPTGHWCALGVSTVISLFQFTPSEINAYGNCLNGIGPCTAEMPVDAGCVLTTCGEFDDDYSVASYLAHNHCAAYDNSSSGSDIGSVNPQVSTETFNSPAHHANYFAVQGLAGTCNRCMAPPPAARR